ncbi:MAG: GNAT family N-acetyltransferase [Actinomycetota bacterium]
MSTRLEVRRLDDADRAAVGSLIAHEQQLARQIAPSVSHTFTDGEHCAAALDVDDDVPAVVATAAGDVVGVLAFHVDGDYALTTPIGFAVEPTAEDPTRVLGAMYAELAPQLLKRGASRHLVGHPAVGALADAVADRGFGRLGVIAARPTGQVPPTPPGVEVRVGTEDDLDAIVELAVVELEFRQASPMFGAISAPDREAMRDHIGRMMRERGDEALVARADAIDVGLLMLESVAPDDGRLIEYEQPFIGPTATAPGHRSRGVGTALVGRAVELARERGHDVLGVSFSSANPLSRPFWLGHGFVPTGYTALRAVHPSHLS